MCTTVRIAVQKVRKKYSTYSCSKSTQKTLEVKLKETGLDLSILDFLPLGIEYRIARIEDRIAHFDTYILARPHHRVSPLPIM